MNTIATLAPTMTSLELLEILNAARAEFGENEVRRNDFNARCRDELAGDHYESFVVTNDNGIKSEAIRLDQDQCMLVLMRESKLVRRRVLEQVKTKQAPKLTPWFDGRIHKPARPGVYQQKSATGWVGYQHWNGKKWSVWCTTAAQAYAQRGGFASPRHQNDDWRGLAEPSEGVEA